MKKVGQNTTVVRGGKYSVGSNLTQKSKYRPSFSITRPSIGKEMNKQSTKGRWFLSCSDQFGREGAETRFALVKLTDDGPFIKPIEDFMLGVEGFDEEIEEGYINCDKKEFRNLFLSYLLAIKEQNKEKIDDILSRCVSVWEKCEAENYASPATALLKRLAP